MIDPDELRAKADSFERDSLRGYPRMDVHAYLGRLALVIEVLGDDLTSEAIVPSDFRPASIRAHTFDVVWRGIDRAKVDAYLAELANEIEALLSAPRASQPALLHLPGDYADRAGQAHLEGILRGARVEVQGVRHSVTFCTSAGLSEDLATRAATGEPILITNTILVAGISEAELTGAIERLDAAGELNLS